MLRILPVATDFKCARFVVSAGSGRTEVESPPKSSPGTRPTTPTDKLVEIAVGAGDLGEWVVVEVVTLPVGEEGVVGVK